MNSFVELPEPTSGQQEQTFRKFLYKCYNKTQSTPPEGWKRDPVFHKYVEVLQDQLANLRNNSTIHIPMGSMEAYVKHVEHLSNSLLTPNIPLYCKRLPRSTQPSPEVLSIKKVIPNNQTTPSASTQKHLRQLIQGSQFGVKTKEKLQMHSQIQESLTDDLLNLAKGLKDKTKAMASALEERNAVIDTVDDALEFSVAGTKEARKKASLTLKRNRMGTCRMLIILLFMGFVFTMMMVFIRVTSFVGYRATTHTNSEL